MVEQFLNNRKFPGAIVKYLENTEIENMAGDAFVLLINVFNEDTVDSVSVIFLQKIVTSMNFINDEQTLNALVSILVMLCAAIDKKLKKEGKTVEE